MRFIRSLSITISFLLFPVLGLSAQGQDDVDAIHQLLDRYGQLEDDGDMASQALLMSPDRAWLSGGGFGRKTDQALNMRYQQVNHDAVREQIAGIRFFSELRDRVIQFLADGDVAVASFYWYTDVVLPADTPADVAAAYVLPVPLLYTTVMEKRGGEWIIVHSHWSNLHPPAGS